MPASTPEEFADDLDDAFQWRRTELSSLKTEIERLDREAEVRPYGRMILRAGVALLYAHWEGFVKQACQHYLDYVARRRLRYSELNVGFITTALRPISSAINRDSAAMAHLAALVSGDGGDRARIPRDGVIDTGSNLRHARLCGILESLGLSGERYSTMEKLIDHRLCDARNDIAHGKGLVPTRDAVLELHQFVIGMMEDVRSQLLDAVFKKEYLSVPSTGSSAS